MVDKFRFDQYENIYIYDKEANAYIYLGKLNGQSKRQFIKDFNDICARNELCEILENN